MICAYCRLDVSECQLEHAARWRKRNLALTVARVRAPWWRRVLAWWRSPNGEELEYIAVSRGTTFLLQDLLTGAAPAPWSRDVPLPERPTPRLG